MNDRKEVTSDKACGTELQLQMLCHTDTIKSEPQSPLSMCDTVETSASDVPVDMKDETCNFDDDQILSGQSKLEPPQPHSLTSGADCDEKDLKDEEPDYIALCSCTDHIKYEPPFPTSVPQADVKSESNDWEKIKSECFDDCKIENEQRLSAASSSKSTTTEDRTGSKAEVQKLHRDIKPFECKVCKKRFNLECSLKLHRKSHAMPHVCQICTSGFGSRSILDMHMITHTREKLFVCDICNKKFTQDSSLKRHRKLHSREKTSVPDPFKCDVCQNCFKHANSLKLHRMSHMSRMPHVCQICKSQFVSASYLKRHMLTHTREKRHVCEICNKKYTYACDLKKHILKFHSHEQTSVPDADIKCKNTDVLTIKTESFEDGHMETNHLSVAAATTGSSKADMQIVCEHCSETFAQVEKLLMHVAVKHGCDTCYKRFDRPGCLQKHLRVDHGIKPFKCDVCKNRFSHAGALKLHQKSHRDWIPHVCQICKRGFVSASYLKRHILAHGREKQYMCELCNKKFTLAGHLKRHLLRLRSCKKKASLRNADVKCEVTGGVKIKTEPVDDRHMKTNHLPAAATTGSSKADMEIVGQHCSETFAEVENLKMLVVRKHGKQDGCDIFYEGLDRPGLLKQHLRVDQGNKPFKCDVCKNRFGNARFLKLHYKSHMNRMPHVCKICKSGFGSGWRLKRHMLTHTGEKLYICEICNKKFTRSSSLNRHLKLHVTKLQYQMQI